MDQTVRISPTVMGADPNRTQMAQPTVMGLAGGGQGGGHRLNSRLNPRIGGAATDIAVHSRFNFVISGLGVGF